MTQKLKVDLSVILTTPITRKQSLTPKQKPRKGDEKKPEVEGGDSQRRLPEAWVRPRGDFRSKQEEPLPPKKHTQLNIPDLFKKGGGAAEDLLADERHEPQRE